MRQVVGWLQLGAAVVLFTTFLTVVAISYGLVAGYELLTGRQP